MSWNILQPHALWIFTSKLQLRFANCHLWNTDGMSWMVWLKWANKNSEIAGKTCTLFCLICEQWCIISDDSSPLTAFSELMSILTQDTYNASAVYPNCGDNLMPENGYLNFQVSCDCPPPPTPSFSCSPYTTYPPIDPTLSKPAKAALISAHVAARAAAVSIWWEIQLECTVDGGRYNHTLQCCSAM